MKLNILRFLFISAPIAAAAYYLWFICLRDGSVAQTLGCVANLVVLVLISWGIPGIVVAMLSPFLKGTVDLCKRVFFNLPFSIVLIVLALLSRGVVSLTCGCVTPD